MHSARPFIPQTKLTDQASTDQAQVQQKKVPFTLVAISLQNKIIHEADPTEAWDVIHTEEGELSNHHQDLAPADWWTGYSEEQNYWDDCKNHKGLVWLGSHPQLRQLFLFS